MSVSCGRPAGANVVSAPALSVSPSGSNIIKATFTPTNCFATIEYRNNGIEYENGTDSSSAATSSRGSWLDAGAVADVWVEQTVNSGTLTSSMGTGRLNLATTRTSYVQRTTNGSSSVSATYDFYDAASGGSLLGTTTITLFAEITF